MTTKKKEQNLKPDAWQQMPFNEDIFSRREKLTTKIKWLVESPGETSQLTCMQSVYKIKKFHFRIAANTSKNIAVFFSHLFVSQRICKYKIPFL